MKIARLATVGSAIALTAGVVFGVLHAQPETSTYLVHSTDVAVASNAVEKLGGTVLSRMTAVGVVGASLTDDQVQQLRSVPGVRVSENTAVGPLSKKSVAGSGTETSAPYSTWSGASEVHAQGITGNGVTVAFVDTGLWNKYSNQLNVIAEIDTVGDTNPGQPGGNDKHGHGTHVMLTALNSEQDESSVTRGIAPGAGLVSVKAFDGNGEGTYLDVIEGINWVIENKDTLNIRVLNLSFGAPPQSFYWEDPLNRAVMSAWASGIVVVVSAGNQGPSAFSIGVPANVPYVISVGAASNNLTSADYSDDFLTSFSSAGPTFEAFVKPELLAPGDRIAAPSFPGGELAKRHRDDRIDGNEYSISGTSQAAAITTGIAALLLEAKPHLSPDDVKCQLLNGSRALLDAEGQTLYTALQQGAGMINAALALASEAGNCANIGLDVNADLSGDSHFRGPVTEAEDGSLVITGPNGEVSDNPAFSWDGTYTYSQGYTWGGGAGNSLWSEGYTWGGGVGSNLSNQGYTWGGGTGTSLWSQGYTWGGGSGTKLWSQGYTWGGGTGNTRLLTNEAITSESPRN